MSLRDEWFPNHHSWACALWFVSSLRWDMGMERSGFGKLRYMCERKSHNSLNNYHRRKIITYLESQELRLYISCDFQI